MSTCSRFNFRGSALRQNHTPKLDALTFRSQKIHELTQQAFVRYRVDQAAARLPGNRTSLYRLYRPNYRSLQTGRSRWSSNAAQRGNASKVIESWDNTNTYIAYNTTLLPCFTQWLLIRQPDDLFQCYRSGRLSRDAYNCLPALCS